MTTPSSAPPVAKREIFGWAMFDFANSSYTTVIVSAVFGAYFIEMVAPAGHGDALWGWGLAVSNLLVVLVSTPLGAIADGAARKKAFLFASYLLCVLSTAALWWVVPGAAGLGLALFVVSNVAFSLGENFTSAFLPEISTPKTIGRISGIGWGIGYLGGMLCLLAVLPLARGGYTLDNLTELRLVGPVTGGFFLLAGLPTFLLLRERARPTPGITLLGRAAAGFRRLGETARSVRHFSELARFLAVFFLYQSGLMAVVAYIGPYAQLDVGFTPPEFMILMVVLQMAAAAGALGFGFLQDRLGPKPVVMMTLILWIGVCVGAFLTRDKVVFWGIGLAAGAAMGSLQSASRSLVGLFSPVEKSGEFFGFWGIAGKAAAACGPLVFGLLASTASRPTAILSVGGFFALGIVGMLFVREERGLEAAERWDLAERRRDARRAEEGAVGTPPP